MKNIKQLRGNENGYFTLFFLQIFAFALVLFCICNCHFSLQFLGEKKPAAACFLAPSLCSCHQPPPSQSAIRFFSLHIIHIIPHTLNHPCDLKSRKSNRTASSWLAFTKILSLLHLFIFSEEIQGTYKSTTFLVNYRYKNYIHHY